MKFATREDIEATIEQAFEAVSDFDGLERAALRRGAEVSRTDTLSVPGAGMRWQAKFPYRNRDRIADMEMMTYDAPNALAMLSKVSGMEALVEIDFVELSRNRTRMNMSIDIRPKTIPARLLLQSARLARSNLARRFKHRVATYARTIDGRVRARQAG